MTIGTVVLTFWMYVIREMEQAIDVCESPGTEADARVRGFDKAVAFYVGSLEGTAGSGEGLLGYNLADKRCIQFKTCGVKGDFSVGTSYVNHKVMEAFRQGQESLRIGNCTATRAQKEEVVRLMTIPLLQSTIQSAYLQSTLPEGKTSSKAEAQGATFAASILPIVHDCGPAGRKDARIIHEQLKMGHGPTSFVEVKSALERQYSCLNITCAEVGGVWNVFGGQYERGAVPCGYVTESSNISTGAIVGASMGGVVLVAALVLIAVLYCRRSSGGKELADETVPAPSANNVEVNMDELEIGTAELT